MIGIGLFDRLVREGCSEGSRNLSEEEIPGRGNSKCKDHESGSGSLRTSLVCWRKSKKAGPTRAERTKWRRLEVEGGVVDKSHSILGLTARGFLFRV